MSSSAPSTPTRDSLAGLLNAMEEESPVPPPLMRKRTLSTTSLAEDGENNGDNAEDFITIFSASAANSNATAIVKRYADHKRLKPEQKAEVDDFFKASSVVRHAKLLVMLMAVDNHLNEIILAQPPFELGDAAETNIEHIVLATLLSSKIPSYKGASPLKTVMTIQELALNTRFSLPPTVGTVPSHRQVAVEFAQEALTQARSKIKKIVARSMKLNKNDADFTPDPADHQGIFDLTEAVVAVSVELCARMALISQRQIFLQCPGSKFWDKLDAALATIRKAAGGDAKKLSRAFRKVLDNDLKAHGTSSSLPVDVPEASAASTFQGEVDELITGPVRQSSPEM
ncbi:hypothetical protein GGX14DRAFT_390346 [Mycena pura]|uniref:Uncharacterized protein n=1 Tax=Mycena pura TaxID=153505 RepID=A0AAD6VSG8_9AGAR|nr:hypothetical protein GGX14DRAFT_390346 [Mycena pura]